MKIKDKEEIEADAGKGQHSLLDDSIIDRMLKVGEISKKDRVLEIGAGSGQITRKLAEAAESVIAVEVDSQFEPYLTALQRKYDNLDVLFGNAINMEFPDFDKIVSNIAFNIAEPLFMKLLNKKFKTGMFIVNESFARKLEGKDESRMSLISPSYFKVEEIEEISPEKISPSPRVYSSVVKVIPLSIEEIDDKKKLIRYFFDKRNSKVKNALRLCIIEYMEDKKEKVTKKQGKEMINDFGIKEEILGKLVDNLSFEDFQEILGFFDKFLDR